MAGKQRILIFGSSLGICPPSVRPPPRHILLSLAAMASFSSARQSVLLLLAVEDLYHEEGARLLGVPIGTVMSRWPRCPERLRRSTRDKSDESVR